MVSGFNLRQHLMVSEALMGGPWAAQQRGRRKQGEARGPAAIHIRAASGLNSGAAGVRPGQMSRQIGDEG